MVINFKKLKSLPVYTESKFYLGKVSDLVINKETHSIRQYEIKRHGLLSPNKLLIDPTQILRIEESQIVVEDNIEKMLAEEERTQQKMATESATTMNSQIND